MLHRIIGSFVTGLFQNIQEQKKSLVFVFVFVLVDEQAISTRIPISSLLRHIRFLSIGFGSMDWGLMAHVFDARESHSSKTLSYFKSWFTIKSLAGC